MSVTKLYNLNYLSSTKKVANNLNLLIQEKVYFSKVNFDNDRIIIKLKVLKKIYIYIYSTFSFDFLSCIYKFDKKKNW